VVIAASALADGVGGSEVEVLNDWKFRGGNGGGNPRRWDEGGGETGEGVGRLSDRLLVLSVAGLREVANRSAIGKGTCPAS
jgi:hypothetical protein